MRGVVAVMLALLVSTVMSGCFVQDEDPETQANGTATATATGSTGTDAGTTTTSGATGTVDGNGTNLPPTANLTASPTNGTAPLNVTFAIDGADPEAGNLTWTLTVGNETLGNGTSVPANHTHAFADAGNYTVVLTVSDGVNNATANVTVTVKAGEAGEEPPETAEDDWVVFNADGTCDAKGEIGGPIYVHERGDPPGTALVDGEGTWVYEESNDISGLQVGGAGDPAYSACLNPDTLIF